MAEIDVEGRIRRSLSSAEYKQLLNDLTAAVRAFDRLGAVAPWLMADFVAKVQARSCSVESVAFSAIQQWIGELKTPSAPATPEPLRVIRGGMS